MGDYLVCIELTTGCSFNVRVDSKVKLSPHFRLYELANTKGKTTLPQFVINEKVMKFLECIEEFRVWYGKSITPTSCYRQIKFNRDCGGDSNSLHLLGLAMDWKWNGTDERRQEIEHQWKVITMQHGLIGGCNWYSNGFHFSVYEDERFGYTNFVHRDYRGVKNKDW